jgi:hypothetical protein
MANKIRLNGTEYNSVQEMAAAARAAYDRALELAAQSGAGTLQPRVHGKFTIKVRFVHGGKTRDNPDEMPPDALRGEKQPAPQALGQRLARRWSCWFPRSLCLHPKDREPQQ